MNESELNIIYLARAGSMAYGTNTPESDEDVRGVCVAPQNYYLGLSRFEQKDKGWTDNTDKVVYDIKKFCGLALDCNPNILEMLYVDESDILSINESGRLLRDSRDLFLSKKVRFSYLGFAFSQLKRIRTHRAWLLNPLPNQPQRKDFGLPGDRKLVTKEQQGAFLWVIAQALKDSLEEAKLSQETLNELRGVNYIGLLQSDLPDNVKQEVKLITGASDNFVDAMMKEKAYSNAMAQWKSYQDWKATRNPKRAVMEAKCGYDAKHALHLIRLIRMGEEILTGKGVIVKRPDREELLAIRNGAWSFEQVEAYAADMEKRFEELYKTSTLPHSPDHKKVEELCERLIMKELGLW